MSSQSELPASPSEPPSDFRVPTGACDCHFHVFVHSAAYPFAPTSTYLPTPASNQAYRATMRSLGFARAVLVQPTPYGTDNRLLIDLLKENADYRGVAAIAGDTSDSELDLLHEVGVRAVRVTSMPRGVEAVPYLEALALRVARHGWHLQLYIGSGTLHKLGDLLANLAVPVVLDHLGGLAAPEVDTPAFDALARLLGTGRVWAKLSGADRASREGPPYLDSLPLMRALASWAPDQLVWGTDWPHSNLKGAPLPDERDLMRLFGLAVSDAGLRRRILVDNPAALYGFTAVNESLDPD